MTVFSEIKRFTPVLFILAVAALPTLTGCSVLGIATANDLETLQTEQTAQSRRTAAQIQTIEQDVQRMDTQLTELQTTTDRLKELERMSRGDLDSLMAEFRAATEELEAMGLSTMAEDLAAARENSARMLANYIERLRTEHTSLATEIAELEAIQRERGMTELPAEDAPLDDLEGGGGQ